MRKLIWVGLVLLGVIIGLTGPGISKRAVQVISDHLDTERPCTINNLFNEKIYNDYTLCDIFVSIDGLRVDIPEAQIRETAEIFTKEYNDFYGLELDPLQGAYIYGQLTIELGLWRQFSNLALSEIGFNLKFINFDGVLPPPPPPPQPFRQGDLSADVWAYYLLYCYSFIPHDTYSPRLEDAAEFKIGCNTSKHEHLERYGVPLGDYQAAFAYGQQDMLKGLLAIINLYAARD